MPTSDNIPDFTGGTQSARGKLNRLAEIANSLGRIRGDGLIRTLHGATGLTIGLDVAALNARLPTRSLIRYGFAVLPENRDGEDDCAWIRPALAAPYVYVKPCDVDAVGTSLVVNEENEDDYVKVYFKTGQYRAPGFRLSEPNIRQDDIIAYHEGSDNLFYAVDYTQDRPLSSTNRIILSDPNITLGEGGGWYFMDDGTSHYMPNTDRDTFGDSVSVVDIKQSLDVEAGDAGVWQNDPHVHAQGSVDHAFWILQVTEGSAGSSEVIGNYARTLVRIN